jgi:hypothetical protein
MLINIWQVYPDNLSVRQFRLAFKSVVRVASPPSPLASTQPLLAATLIELAHERALASSSTLLPPSTQSPEDNALETAPLQSEKSGVILAIIDSLPSLVVEDLEEFLPLTARLINTIDNNNNNNNGDDNNGNDHALRATCIERFWEVLSNGEMDVERANSCVAWWSTRGGRELLLFGERYEQQLESDVAEEHVMSGAVVVDARESKL